jgi:hypothetical protein
VTRVQPSTARQLDGDDLGDLLDPYQCVECLAAGDSCVFHAGFAAGWDACAASVARVVNGDA